MSFTKAPISAVITDAVGNTINLGNASGAFTAAPQSIVLTDANGNTLNVGPGVVQKVDLTAQGANIAKTTLYAVPAGQGGLYRISAYAVVTQAATTSSTLPGIFIFFTDVDTGTVQGGANGYALTGSPSTNTVGTNSTSQGQLNGIIEINAQAGSNIQWQTLNYASSGATPMQFAIHLKVEYIGA